MVIKIDLTFQVKSELNMMMMLYYHETTLQIECSEWNVFYFQVTKQQIMQWYADV
jgi:hypothetical protein